MGQPASHFTPVCFLTLLYPSEHGSEIFYRLLLLRLYYDSAAKNTCSRVDSTKTRNKAHAERPVRGPDCFKPRNRVWTSDERVKLPPRLWTECSFSLSTADIEPSLTEFVGFAAGRGEYVVDHDLPFEPARVKIASACIEIAKNSGVRLWTSNR